MKLTVATHSDSQTSEYVIDLPLRSDEGRGPGRMNFLLNGEPGEINWEEVEPGVYSFLDGGKSIVATVRAVTGGIAASSAPAGRLQFEITVSGRAINAEIKNQRGRTGSAATGDHDADAGIVASMPGRIAKVLVAENADVAKGDGLLIIEAMKMQNEIRSPRSARVAKIHVREGEGVETGARLVTFG